MRRRSRYRAIEPYEPSVSLASTTPSLHLTPRTLLPVTTWRGQRGERVGAPRRGRTRGRGKERDGRGGRTGCSVCVEGAPWLDAAIISLLVPAQSFKTRPKVGARGSGSTTKEKLTLVSLVKMGQQCGPVGVALCVAGDGRARHNARHLPLQRCAASAAALK